MSRRCQFALGITFLLLLSWPCETAVRADQHEHSHKHVKSTQATPHTMKQAGYPQEVSHISMESYNEHYNGGFIGGGKGGHGSHERCANDGTWGWDYAPFRPMSSHIFLKWSHGRHYQGGVGAYATDGPKPLEHIKETIHEHLGGGD